MMKDESLVNQDNYVKVQPSYDSVSAVWAKRHWFDKNSQPVEYLN